MFIHILHNTNFYAEPFMKFSRWTVISV